MADFWWLDIHYNNLPERWVDISYRISTIDFWWSCWGFYHANSSNILVNYFVRVHQPQPTSSWVTSCSSSNNFSPVDTSWATREHQQFSAMITVQRLGKLVTWSTFPWQTDHQLPFRPEISTKIVLRELGGIAENYWTLLGIMIGNCWELPRSLIYTDVAIQ